jgi:putative endopeptidase
LKSPFKFVSFAKLNKVHMKKLFLLFLAGSLLASCSCETETPEKGTPKYFGFNLANLDSSVHVCEDFFRFSSGGWIEENPVPDTEGRWGQFQILDQLTKERMKGLLDSIGKLENLKKGSQEQLLADLYHTGMDTASRAQAGASPLDPMLGKVRGLQNPDALPILFARMKTWGASAPFGISVRPDKKASHINVLYVQQSGLGMPDRDYYINNDEKSQTIREAYLEYVAQLFVLSGKEATQASEKADQVMFVEKQLAENQMSRTENRSPERTYNPFPMSEANKSVFPFRDYLAQLNINTERLVISQPEYMRFLKKAMGDIPIENWIAYLEFHLLHGHATKLSPDFEQVSFDFNSKTLKGIKSMQPRWKRIQSDMNVLGEQMGYLYVSRYFPESSKAKMEEMVTNIRDAYHGRIAQLDWMSPETKMKAREKLDAFTWKIGYPDTWEDWSDLRINRERYFDNMLAIHQYKLAKDFQKIDRPVDKSEWYMGAHIVNAYYNPAFNEIVFPAAILQFPFFDPNSDDAINYGAIGGVIGHEFTHGFDDQGSKYDAQGNLENWWTPGDRARFEALADKIVSQYESYEPLPGVFVNGRLTLGENIADLGGLTLAYHAYVNSRSMFEEADSLIDGFTGRQRVFLGWAQVWQSNATDAFLRNMVLTDPHSPAVFRVRGPVTNIPEFYDAFGCNLPSNPVVIW